MPAQYAIQEDNSRYYDSAPTLCQFAGTPGGCADGTPAHPDSLGDCCARCEYDGYIYECDLIKKRMATAVWPETEILRGEYQSTLADAMRWIQPMCDQSMSRPVKHLREYPESVAA